MTVPRPLATPRQDGQDSGSLHRARAVGGAELQVRDDARGGDRARTTAGQEALGKKLRELTVHHRDHNHDNNPPDGSNWELLCIYCHDNEHARHQVADAYGETTPGEEHEPSSTYQPFADLEELLKRKT